MNHTYFQFCKHILKDKVNKSVGRYFSSKWPIRVHPTSPARSCVGQSFYCVCESLTHTPHPENKRGAMAVQACGPSAALWTVGREGCSAYCSPAFQRPVHFANARQQTWMKGRFLTIVKMLNIEL